MHIGSQEFFKETASKIFIFNKKFQEKQLLNKKTLFILIGLLSINGLFAISGDLKDDTVQTQQNYMGNVDIRKDQKKVTFIIENKYKTPYLWIKAYGKDTRKLEHGITPLYIEVNGTVIKDDRSVLQDITYTTPCHQINYAKQQYKYDKMKKAWYFKKDVDFIMNNTNGSEIAKKSPYITMNQNHWYAFNMEGIAREGKNEIVLTDLLEDGMWRKNYHDGYHIGEIGFFSLDEIKNKIAEYNKNQIRLPSSILAKKTEPPIPLGNAVSSEVKNGYLVKDGKPFLLLHVQTYPEQFDNTYQNMLFFNWGNVVELEKSINEIAGSDGYLTDGWNKSDALAVKPLNDAAIAYKNDMLCELYFTPLNLNTALLTDGVKSRIPDLYAVNSKGDLATVGDWGGTFPNLGSTLYKKYAGEVIAMMAQKMNKHPGLFANVAHEELRWRCNGKFLPPQDDGSKIKYRDFLKNKYSDIKKLNSEWFTNYSDFSDIVPPATREQSANFINFQIFRTLILQSYSESIYKDLKKYFPGKPVCAERSGGQWFPFGWEVGESWTLNSKWSDIRTIGGGGVPLARAAKRYYQKEGRDFVLQNDICFRCEYQYTKDPRTPFWQAPNEKDSNGIERSRYGFYNKIIRDIFEGVKASFYFAYSGYQSHFLHNQKFFLTQGLPSTTEPWHVKLKDLKLPDVIIPQNAKDLTEANKLCYKTTPLLLPAQVDKGKAGVLYTRRSSLIGWNFKDLLQGKESWQITSTEWRYLEKLLEHLQLPFEVFTEDTFDNDMDDCKLLIAGYWANMGSSQMAERIKNFVNKGNTVVFYPDAFCYDWNTTKDLAVSPGYELDKLFCAKVKGRISGKSVTVKMTEDISPALKKGDSFQVRGLVTPLEKLEGGKVLAVIAETGEPVIISANDNKTYYLGFVPGLSYSTEIENGRKIRELFSEIVKNSQIRRPIEIQDSKDSYFVYSRIMHGKDYYLATFLNEYWMPQKISAKLNFLPEGKQYDIIDVTDSGKPAMLIQKQSVEFFKKNGINLSLEPLRGRVLIIRASDIDVIADCPAYELKALTANKNIDIVLPENTSGSVMNAIEKLKTSLSAQGTVLRILKPDEIPVKLIETSLTEGGYPLAKVKSKILDTQNNLILIGNTDNNKLIANLCETGNYTYDKVIDDVDSTYPGKGKGVIQISESINKPYYCPTDRSREAILIGGSDDNGTIKAIEKFISGITKK